MISKGRLSKLVVVSIMSDVDEVDANDDVNDGSIGLANAAFELILIRLAATGQKSSTFAGSSIVPEGIGSTI
jgi:hypothetical protein